MVSRSGRATKRLAHGSSRGFSSQRRLQIGLGKIVTFEEQRRVSGLGQCVGKAVAEIQPCGMSTALAEIGVGLPGELPVKLRREKRTVSAAPAPPEPRAGRSR